MAKRYYDEKTGQMDFFNALRLDKDVSFVDYTDGVIDGTLFEFKLTIGDINRVLSQAIKYLSRMRIKGESVPAHILLVDLNNERAYHFNSADFSDDIHNVYIGAASKDNGVFHTNILPENIDTSNRHGISRVLEIVENKQYIKISIDENCVIGWAQRFYNENPFAQKRHFFEELRHPSHFTDFILPWTGSEDDFRFIMDCLNDKLNRKELGAFFTPPEYCKISCEMVRRAISEIPAGNDYIILDRCAGTGNLEQFFTDDELAHCVVGTYELKEWQVLNYLIGDKVKCIIPPLDSRLNRPLMEQENLLSHNDLECGNGLLAGADALAIDVFEQVRQYVDDPNCNIIMLENPPYRERNANHYGERNSNVTERSFVAEQMINEGIHNEARDLSNQFIWSAWKYYLKKPDDQFILYSPIKYWKSLGLSDKEFKEGYLFNRKYFHATPSAISCIRWRNVSQNIERIILKAVDIVSIDCEHQAIEFKNIEIKKVHSSLNSLYDKRVFPDDKKDGIWCGNDGYEKTGRGTPIYNENIIACLRVEGFSCAPMTVNLTRCDNYIDRGFYLRSDNYLQKLPLFCAKLYPQEKWYERDIYFSTADRGTEYVSDEDLLRSCLIYVALCPRNKCVSFNGSDRRFYRNELCFDDGTLATCDLENMNLTDKDNELLELWHRILNLAKQKSEYNPGYTYGLWQIESEINVFCDERGRVWSDTDKKEENKRRKEQNESKLDLSPKYTDLNTAINAIKPALREYYKTQIQDKLFLYELLK